MSKIMFAVVVFLVFFSVAVNTPLSSADSVLIPEMQKPLVEKKITGSAGVTAQVYVNIIPTS